MASLNRVQIMGNLGRDPEMHYTTNRVPVVTLNVATTNSYTDKDGLRQESTEWHRVVVWNRNAEACAQYLSKGRQVFVEGRLQTRSWEGKDGDKRYVTEIVATNVQFLGSSVRDSITPESFERTDSEASTVGVASESPESGNREKEKATPGEKTVLKTGQTSARGRKRVSKATPNFSESAAIDLSAEQFEDVPF